MIRRWIGLVIVAVGLAGSTALAAQDLLPCQPLAPGARCSATLSGNVWRVDFGAPKPAPAPAPAAEHWQWRGATHRDMSNRLMPAPSLVTPLLLDHPVDCKMQKHGDAAVDQKILAPHPGHTVATGRIVTVAPCKSK